MAEGAEVHRLGRSECSVRREPKLGIGFNPRVREPALETFRKRRSAGRLGLSEVADCLDRAGSEERVESAGAARDGDGLNCRKKPNPWGGGAGRRGTRGPTETPER